MIVKAFGIPGRAVSVRSLDAYQRAATEQGHARRHEPAPAPDNTEIALEVDRQVRALIRRWFA